MIPTDGDLVAITHDMPHWGKGGEVMAVKYSLILASLLVGVGSSNSVSAADANVDWRSPFVGASVSYSGAVGNNAAKTDNDGTTLLSGNFADAIA